MSAEESHMMNTGTTPLLVNGFTTFLLGLLLIYKVLSKKLETHVFYISWGLGFTIYGVEILIRDYIPEYWLVLIGSLMYSLLTLGAWGLSSRKVMLAAPITSILLSGLWIIGVFPMEAAVPFFFGSITLGLVYNRKVFGEIIDKLLVGWLMLLLANFLLWENWSVDVFAFFAKIIIYFGVLDQKFTLVAEKIRVSKGHFPSTTSGGEREGGISIVIPGENGTAEKEIEWMTNQTEKSLKGGVNTYIFSFQDLPSHDALRRIRWIDPKRIFVFLFSSSSQKAKEDFTVFNMGLIEVGAALSEIIKEYREDEKRCNIMFTNLSLLVNLFGRNEVYEMLLEKLGGIRESGTKLYAVFHPEMHNDATTAALFKGIADYCIRI